MWALFQKMSSNSHRVRLCEMNKKKWYDYLWIFSAFYLMLGFFNILFAWLGLICFLTPIFIAGFGGSKVYCNKYCGRAQLLNLLGNRYKLSCNKKTPTLLKTKWFRYGFLLFFLSMFAVMLFNTYLVFSGKSLQQIVTLLWTFNLPWSFAYHSTNTAPWIAQFSFGFYSLMLTSTLLGILSMFLFKPRSWCVVCPMGTMTQLICKVKDRAN
jgi:hypothetical protein